MSERLAVTRILRPSYTKSSRKLAALLLASASFTMAAPSLTLAQQATSATSDSSDQIETVTVSAQRRAQNMQSVPIAITAITADQLASSGITTTANLSAEVPGLALTQNLTGGSPFIRGIGTTNSLLGQEASVATYVDGVYIASPSATLFDLNNVDHVEVLKGPQGTLFGRNATGGVIQVITRDPSQDTSANAMMGYGNYDTLSGSFYGTTGLTDDVAADIALYGSNQGEGWGKNLTTGQDAFTSTSLSGRSKIRWDLSQSTNVTLALDYSYEQNELGEGYHMLPGSLGIDGVTRYAGFYNTQGDPNDLATIRQGGVSLTINHDFDFATLRSISAFREITVDARYDEDATPVPFTEIFSTQREGSFSQEVQLLSPEASKVNWILGAYYLRDSAAFLPVTNMGGPSFDDTTSSYIYARQDTNSYAGYAQATVPIFDATNFTAGLRYTADDRTIQGHLVDAGSVLLPETQSMDADKLTWRLSLDHQFTDNFMGYVSYNTGFKSGIYNTIVYFEPSVKPENLNAYEAGFKSEFFDHRLRFNGSAFYYGYHDIQINDIQDGTSVLLNAARATIKGVDADVDVFLTNELKLTGGFSVLDGKYDSFLDAPHYVLQPGGGAVAEPIDASGYPTENTPKFTLSSVLSYAHQVNWGVVEADLSYSYNSGFSFTPADEVRQPAYNLLGLSLGWHSEDSVWGMRVYGNNLLSAKYYNSMIASTVGYQGTPAAPLTYGLQVTRNF